jgi:nitroreductase
MLPSKGSFKSVVLIWIPINNYYNRSSKKTCIALANMMTSAASTGIDPYFIEGFHQEKTEVSSQREFGTDTNKYGLAIMVAFGNKRTLPTLNLVAILRIMGLGNNT